jgi:hypothetical protein
VARRLTDPRTDEAFRRSSYCGTGDCVEVAQRRDGAISVRDSKNPVQQELVFTRDEWLSFLRGAKSGEFDFDVNAAVGVESATVRFTR